MKRIIYGLLTVCLLFSCQEKPVENGGEQIREEVKDSYFVSQEDAMEIAATFRPEGEWILRGTDQDYTSLRSVNEQYSFEPAYYIFEGAQEGFLIVSASEVAYPILGYADSGMLDMENLPCGLEYMLSVYANNINAARVEGLSPSNEMRALRADEPGAEVVVEPLLGDIEWNQTPYYNDYAPMVSYYGMSIQAPIGCVATATAQIMRYHEYPDRAEGHFRYQPRDMGWLEYDFNYALEWDKMPKAELKEPNEMVARFMYGVAVSVEMNFGPSSGTTHDKVPPALIRFYKYPKNITHIQRATVGNVLWPSIIESELDAARPVLYGGVGDGGGHSFVCDGYATNDMYHFNWGWGGQSNGWFKLDALNPDDLGAGGGSGGYNANQDIVINIAPPARILGDDNDPVAIEEDDDSTETLDVENGVDYHMIKVYHPEDLFIYYTNFNGVETVTRGTGHTLYNDRLIEATAGEDLTFTVEIDGNTPGLTPLLGIFIDYNDNEGFYVGDRVIYSYDDNWNVVEDRTPFNDENERVILEKVTDGVLTGTFTIPANVDKGIHRLRVMLQHQDDPDKYTHPNANSLLIGEVEDYFIEIK